MAIYDKKLSPMLASLGNFSALKQDFIFEPKLDGTRCLLYKIGNKIKMLNRRGNWFQNRFPEIVADAQKLKGNLILDGEIVVLNKKGIPDFNLLQSRDQVENSFKIALLSRQIPATFYVFDILMFGKQDCTKLKLISRKKILSKVLSEAKSLKHIREVLFTKNGLALWQEVKKKNLEGLVAKKESSRYEIGKRSKEWLKIKNIKTADCVICGYTTNRKPIASLILGQYYENKLIHVGEVGTGLDEAQLSSLYKILEKAKTKKPIFPDLKLKKKIFWVSPKYVVEVKFLEYTKSLRLRAPSFIRLRFDKPLKDCVVEL